MKIGIIREAKVPPDSRVLFTPEQCKILQKKYDVEFVIQPSKVRCFADAAYQKEGLNVSEDICDCSVLVGIKEIPKKLLVPNKTYLIFSHTIKEQAYNRTLLQEVIKKNITLLDYEAFTNTKKQRIITFGRFAGIVGAHNGIMAYGKRTGAFSLDQMHKYSDYAMAIAQYKTLDFPKMKIVLTGTGRVANGAAEVLNYMGIEKVSPTDFLTKEYQTAVYTKLDCKDYVVKKNSCSDFDKQDFFQNPKNYKSIFEPYTRIADLMINGVYWDNNAPVFFSKKDMAKDYFNIKVIADITCDIAPVSSIPSTLFATTIDNPVFGYDPIKMVATEPCQAHTIDMMTIDNLPNELAKDASKAFGEQFISNVMEELLGIKNTGMIERSTIAINGQLGKHFQYLSNYLLLGHSQL